MMMTKTRGFARLLSAAAVAGLLAAGPLAAQDAEVLARVNGNEITKSDVELAAEVFGPQLQQIPEGARQSIILDALVDMHVLADAAKAEGLDESETFKQRMEFLRTQALRNTFIEEKVQNAVTDADLAARYEKDIAGYTPPEEVKASHILVKTKEEADQIIKDLEAGGDFAAIASEKSLDPGSKQTGGDLGYFSKGQMVPAFEEAAFALEPGSFTKEPVESQFGFHVIKTEDKRSQPVPSLEDVKPQVQEVVQREKFQEILTSLKEGAKIERLDDAAEGTAPAATEQPAQ